jgi:hypothetical protein
MLMLVVVVVVVVVVVAQLGSRLTHYQINFKFSVKRFLVKDSLFFLVSENMS